MKTMILAAAAAFLVLGGAASARDVGSDASAVQAPAAATATATTGQAPQGARGSFQMERQPGVASPDMRSNGSMLDGRLPADGWG